MPATFRSEVQIAALHFSSDIPRMVISIAATGVPSLIIEGSQGLSKSSSIGSLCADEVQMARGQRGTRQEPPDPSMKEAGRKI